MPIDVVIHADWGTAPEKRWAAEARRIDGHWMAAAPRAVPDPAALLALGQDRLVGFDFPIGLPIAYARKIGIDDFLSALPRFGNGDWDCFYLPAASPQEISLYRPFYPRRPGGSKHLHLCAGLGVASMDDLRRECDRSHTTRGPAEVMFWTLGPSQVGRAAIAGWRDLLAPALDRVRIWPFQGALNELVAEGGVVVCETYPGEFYAHLGLPRKKTAAARREAAKALLLAASKIGIGLDSGVVDDVKSGFVNDDAYDAFVGLVGMLNVLEGFRTEGDLSNGAVRRVEGWMLGRAANPAT
jgi:hypothetical protein